MDLSSWPPMYGPCVSGPVLRLSSGLFSCQFFWLSKVARSEPREEQCKSFIGNYFFTNLLSDLHIYVYKKNGAMPVFDEFFNQNHGNVKVVRVPMFSEITGTN